MTAREGLYGLARTVRFRPHVIRAVAWAILVCATALPPPALAQQQPSESPPSVVEPPPGGETIPAPPAATPAQIPAAEAADTKTHDLTPLGMFLAADPVVQGVMTLLAAASVVTWAILLGKALTLILARRRMKASLRELRSAVSLTEAGQRVRRGVGALLLVETQAELALSQGLPGEGVKERVAIALNRIEATTGKRMASGTGILATIGSVSPFVGLFGTVWGIMGSFIGIANSNTTNLAVVAPGIAEALLATGIGLVAAIPAVVIYNALARSITGYRAMVGDAVALIMRHLSRDLDRHALDRHRGARGLRFAAE
jgi:biopolymer transport protein ExbB